MSVAHAKLAALVESDPDALNALVDLYLAAYGGGAFTALINAPALHSDPLSSHRCRAAEVLAVDLIERCQGDPAVMLQLAEGLKATLRGDGPEATFIESHASRARS